MKFSANVKREYINIYRTMNVSVGFKRTSLILQEICSFSCAESYDSRLGESEM